MKLSEMTGKDMYDLCMEERIMDELEHDEIKENIFWERIDKLINKIKGKM